jgi:hypothetical protein
MKDQTEDHNGQKVDAISNELIEEFWEHVEECKRTNPQMTDPNIIFQGWAIQKIAGLHGLTLNLVERISELESRSKKR